MLEANDPKMRLQMLMATIMHDLQGPVNLAINFSAFILDLLPDWETEKETIVSVCEMHLQSLQGLLRILSDYPDEISQSNDEANITLKPVSSNDHTQVTHDILQRLRVEFTQLHERVITISGMATEVDKPAVRETMRSLLEANLQQATDLLTLFHDLYNKYSNSRA